MRGLTFLLAGLAALGGAGVAAAGESLTPAAALPLHDKRDCYSPAAAYGADQFLVVWQSGRLAPGDLRDGPVFNGDIVGCRVDKAGKAIDAAPFVVSGAADLQERPQVAFGKDCYLVVWQDVRHGKDYDVYAARVRPDGKVLDPDGIRVSAGAHNQAQPAVAWDGKTFVVAWADARSNAAYEVYAARVSAADGKVLDPDGILASSGKAEMHRFAPVIASRGDGKSLVFWNGSKLAGYGFVPWCGSLIVEDGAVRETYTLSAPKKGPPGTPGPSNNPMCLAAGPKVYLASWSTAKNLGRASGDLTNNATLFDPAGKRIVEEMTVAAGKRLLLAPAAGWDGSAFVVAWHERLQSPKKLTFDAARVCRLTAENGPADVVHDLAGTPDAPARAVAVASNGTGTTLIAYEQHPARPETPITIAFRILAAK